jgi:hypothetical protein
VARRETRSAVGENGVGQNLESLGMPVRAGVPGSSVTSRKIRSPVWSGQAAWEMGTRMFSKRNNRGLWALGRVSG